MNPLRTAVHFAMELTCLDRLVDAAAINRRRERWRARFSPPLDAEDSNRWIGELIAAGKPAAVGQLLPAECGVLAAHLGVRQFYKYTWAAPSYSEAELGPLGLFPPNDEIYWRFCELLLDRLRHVDAMAPRLNVGETQILAQCCPDARRLQIRSLEPYLFSSPWSAQLAGKRILVIHASEVVIRNQFARRREIWPARPEILPDCHLEVARSSQGVLYDCFPNWPTMLAWFEQQVERIYDRSRFEIALIAGDLAGIPLAVHAKKLGAIGIRLGSFTSTLFGIRDSQETPSPELAPFFNAAWVKEKPRTPVARPSR